MSAPLPPGLGDFLAGLRRELEKLPARPPEGDLLRRAMEIPLAWPEAEFPAGRPLVQQFERALLPWGGKMHRVAREADAAEKIAQIAREAAAELGRRLVATRWRTPGLDRLGIDAAMAPLDAEWILPTAEERARCGQEAGRREMIARMERLDLGITDCEIAVAHTASVVVRHGAERDGYSSLFPWTNIVVVWAAQIVGTVQEAVERLAREQGGQPWPGNLQFITGPSRSGDIDIIAGQGAAGPGRYHAVVIEEPAP